MGIGFINDLQILLKNKFFLGVGLCPWTPDYTRDFYLHCWLPPAVNKKLPVDQLPVFSTSVSYTRKCGMVLLSVTSVCACLSVCCNAVAFESLDLESHWYSTSSEYLVQVLI